MLLEIMHHWFGTDTRLQRELILTNCADRRDYHVLGLTFTPQKFLDAISFMDFHIISRGELSIYGKLVNAPKLLK